MADIAKKVILSEEQIHARIKELAAQISADYSCRYPGEPVHLICILKGGIMFLTELAKHLTIPVSMDFIGISSYGMATKSSGVVRITKDLDESIEGKNVLIVEDIIDSGLTLHYLVTNLLSREPADLKICTLLDKLEGRKVAIEADYVGFKVPNAFLVGYGLDYNGLYRNIPYVFVPTDEALTKLS